MSNEAIDAGVKAVLSQHGIEWRLPPTEDVVWPVAWVALEAAAPAIAAAERERCAQLAEQYHAVYLLANEAGFPYDLKPFADLIRKEAPDGAQ